MGVIAIDRVEYALRSVLGLRPMLKRELSAFRSDAPESNPPAMQALSYRTLMNWRWGALGRDLGRSDARMTEALAVAEREVEAAGIAPVEKALPLPEMQAEDVTSERFREAVRKPVPLVVRGWFRDTRAVREWSVPYLLEHYGDSEVLLSGPEKGEHLGPLNSIERPGVYMHNGEILLKRHPELVEHIELGRLKERSPRSFMYYTAQLFAGLGGTGTPYHCANQVNYFIMVSGRKRWTFVDPRFTMLMYPAITSHAGYFSSRVGWASAPADDTPLYAYAPRYVVDLDPGDVVFNPPWWWHSVENLTDASVGVSTRWHSPFADTNLLFNLLQNIDRRILRIHYMLAREKIVNGQDMGPWDGERTAFEVLSHDEEDETIYNPTMRPAHKAREDDRLT